MVVDRRRFVEEHSPVPVSIHLGRRRLHRGRGISDREAFGVGAVPGGVQAGEEGQDRRPEGLGLLAADAVVVGHPVQHGEVGTRPRGGEAVRTVGIELGGQAEVALGLGPPGNLQDEVDDPDADLLQFGRRVIAEVVCGPLEVH